MSENIKLGLQYRYQQGKVQINHNRFLGYTKDENGNLVIDPEQAEIVKRIYWEYLEGSSMDKMPTGLWLTASHRRWQNKMAHQHHQQDSRNEKYMGDACFKDLHHRLPDKKANQEQRHRSSILRRGRP